jgi:hypothetical protein
MGRRGARFTGDAPSFTGGDEVGEKRHKGEGETMWARSDRREGEGEMMWARSSHSTEDESSLIS